MLRKTLLPVLAACVFAGAMAADGAARGYWKQCEPVIEGQPTILAHGVTCRRSQNLISHLYEEAQRVPRPSRFIRIDGFGCRLATGAGTPDGPKRAITCRRHEKIVKAAVPG